VSLSLGSTLNPNSVVYSSTKIVPLTSFYIASFVIMKMRIHAFKHDCSLRIALVDLGEKHENC